MNIIKKQYCKRGHDTFICGRAKSGNCKACIQADRKIVYTNLSDGEREKERIRKRDSARQHPETSRKRYLDNRESKIAAAKRWQIEHRQERLVYLRDYNKKREETDPSFKLAKRLRHRVRQAIKTNGKSGSAVKDLGCSIDFLKQYLELKFLSGMTWDNWGYGVNRWHIDHIIPLSSFDLTDRVQFLKACHYTNLQPLWQVDNFKKGGINRVSK